MAERGWKSEGGENCVECVCVEKVVQCEVQEVERSGRQREVCGMKRK